jgi:hypothetical protein
LKDEVENEKYKNLLKKIQEEINQLPKDFKNSLLELQNPHNVKIVITDSTEIT